MFIKKYLVITAYIKFSVLGYIHFHQKKNVHRKNQNGRSFLIVQVYPKTEKYQSLQSKPKWEYAPNILLIKDQLMNIPIQPTTHFSY